MNRPIVFAAVIFLILVAGLVQFNRTEGEREYRIYPDGEWMAENTSQIRQYAEETGDPNVMVEVSEYAGTEPNDRQLKEAWNLYNSAYKNAVEESWMDKDEGLSDGYFNWRGDRFHYPHVNYTQDEQTLDPEKPEFLMYYELPDSNSSILAGVMFQTSSLQDEGRQIGGPVTTWHYHYHDPDVCLEYWGPVSNTEVEPEGECPDETKRSERTFEMLHVWFVDHPESQFSSDMIVSQDTLSGGLEKLNRSEFMSKHS